MATVEPASSGLEHPDPNIQGATHWIPLQQLVPRAAQPRRYFDPEKLDGLARSIRNQGVLEDLLVRPIEGNRFEIVFGERRFRAAQLAGLEQLPCKIKPLSDEETLELSIIENLQREDINPIEETEGILALLASKLNLSTAQVIQLLHRMQNEAKGKTTPNVLGSLEGQTVTNLFQMIGRLSWLSFVSARLPLLKLPEELLEALRQGRIEYSKAKAIAKLKLPEERQSLLEEAIAADLSLKQIQDRVKALMPSEEPFSPQAEINSIARRLRLSKLWKTDPEKWQRAQTLLQELESLLVESDQEIQEDS